MILLAPDYKKLVTETYKKMRLDNKLSTLLAKPTRSNIRRECLQVFHNRYRSEDNNILKGFFGKANSKLEFLALLEGSRAEQFRTLNNYLKEETENTDHANLELLAWLIDFRYRPWSLGMDVDLNDEEKILLDEPLKSPEKSSEENNNTQPRSNDLEEERKKPSVNVEDAYNLSSKPTFPAFEEYDIPTAMGATDSIPGNEVDEKPVQNPLPFQTVPDSKTGRWFMPKTKSMMIALMMVVIVSSTYTAFKVIGNTGRCMYWKEDHYEEVSCDEVANGRRFIPLDKKRMESFEKITQKDTITEWSIGKIYYIKDSNTIEYYTNGGEYPEDVNRNVKKLSRHIFDKYLSKKNTLVKDTLSTQEMKLADKNK